MAGLEPGVAQQVAELACDRDLARVRPNTLGNTRMLLELSRFSDRLAADVELRTKLDGMAADLAVFAVSRYGEEVTTIITHTIDRWDGKEAARKIELHVGRDLQFIRINGTIVGGLVGLVIHTVVVLIGAG